MLKCPHCQATLPDFSQGCQFCGKQWGAPAGSPQAKRQGRGGGGSPGWVWPAYYAIAGWWILDGLRVLLAAITGSVSVGIIGLVVGVITLLVGVGLVFKVELARGIVNVLCFLQILSGAFSIVMGFFFAPIMGLWGIIWMILSFVQIGTAGLMIFLIGETETRGPNF